MPPCWINELLDCQKDKKQASNDSHTFVASRSMEAAFAVNGGKSRSKDGFWEMKRGHQEGWEWLILGSLLQVVLNTINQREKMRKIFKTPVLLVAEKD